MERMFKGEVLLKFVNLIQASRDLPWENHLTEEDMEIVNSMVLPAKWYPAESYMRMALAAHRLVSKGEVERVKPFGRATMNELLQGPYGAHLKGREPADAIDKYLAIRRNLMNFSNMVVERTVEKSCRVRISEIGRFDGMDLYCIMLGAQFEVLIEANGGKEPKTEWREIEEQGEPVYSFDLEWK
jgi:hypothetical protein